MFGGVLDDVVIDDVWRSDAQRACCVPGVLRWELFLWEWLPRSLQSESCKDMMQHEAEDACFHCVQVEVEEGNQPTVTPLYLLFIIPAAAAESLGDSDWTGFC
ncbi:hypothetical protein CRENBAI_002874 [Crenichthys baileyi]|uniref:Uncharacterized protein n=1 Tax=Crenichthys baileyi TaxID=28760 RepID=A0AAV9RBY1_9TELE